MGYWSEGGGKRVGVMGLGVSGIAAAALLKSRGFSVTGFDISPSLERPREVDLLVIGPGTPGDVEKLDGLVVSPGSTPGPGCPARRSGWGFP